MVGQTCPAAPLVISVVLSSSIAGARARMHQTLYLPLLKLLTKSTAGTGNVAHIAERVHQAMEDTDKLIEIAAIQRMMFDYSYHLDMNHPEALAALFVEDCEVSYAPNFAASGMEAYKKTLDGIGTYFRATSHHNSNIAVDFTSDTEANVRSVVLAIHRYTKERPDGILYGQYFDVVVKCDGQWKFKRRELRTTMTADYHVRTFNPIGRAE